MGSNEIDSIYDTIYKSYRILIIADWDNESSYRMMIFNPGNLHCSSTAIYKDLQTAKNVAMSSIDGDVAQREYEAYLDSIVGENIEMHSDKPTASEAAQLVPEVKKAWRQLVEEEWFASRKKFGLTDISFSGMNGRIELTLMEEQEDQNGRDWRHHFCDYLIDHGDELSINELNILSDRLIADKETLYDLHYEYIDEGDKNLASEKWQDAIVSFSKAILAQPDSAQGHAKLALSLFYSKNYEDAIKISEATLPLWPRNNTEAIAMTYHLLGNCHSGCGNSLKATLAYENAHKIAPATHNAP